VEQALFWEKVGGTGPSENAFFQKTRWNTGGTAFFYVFGEKNPSEMAENCASKTQGGTARWYRIWFKKGDDFYNLFRLKPSF